MIDLHTHSNISDGDYRPAELVQEAQKKGITALALTDHDTLDGLEAAGNAAKAAGIQFIPGIEINIQWAGEGGRAGGHAGSGATGISGIGPGGEFHLLGLGIRSPSPAFRAAISELSRRREARNYAILDRMHELSIEATWEEVFALSGGHSVGRPHFARLLINKKIVRNTEQAFARYLKPGKPLYVPKVGLVFGEAAALIRESGGIPVLAHPMSLYVAWGRLPDLIKTLKNRGLMGIEAWHPTAQASSCRRLEKLGRELGLYVTEGSDFHGAILSRRQLGYSNRGREISDAVLQAIPELC
jgi:predicted metal-dependent phosphoesterase TrpH